MTRKKAGGRRRTEAFTHTKAFWHREGFTKRNFLHTEGVTPRSLYSKGLLHSNVSELLHIDVFTRRSLYKEWGRKKEGSIRRCVLEVLVQRSLVDLSRICRLFLVLSTRRNCVVYNVLVPLAFKKRLSQHTGNYVNTSVSAIPGPHNTVNTVIFAIRGSKSHLKKKLFCAGAESTTSVFTVFFVPRSSAIA